MRLEREPTKQEYKSGIDIIMKMDKININNIAEQAGINHNAVYGFYKGEYKRAPNEDLISTIASVLGFVDGSQFKRFCMDAKYSGTASIRHCLTIGDTQTLWWRAVGTGERGEEIFPENIRTIVHADRKVDIRSGELNRRIHQILEEHAHGRINFSNDPLLSLDGLTPITVGDQPVVLSYLQNWPPVGENEHRFLGLSFRLTDYASFYTVARDENGRQIAQRLLRDWKPEDGPDPALSFGVGMNVAILTADDQLIFGERSNTQGARQGELDIGAVEGISVKKDLENNSVDLHSVARRAVREEYGLTDRDIDELHVLGFGYDLQYCQWNAIAVCYTNKISKNIHRIQKIRAIDAAEFAEFIPISSDPGEVFSFLSRTDHRFWSCGLSTVFYSLVHRYGMDRVFDAAEGFSPKDKNQYLLHIR